MKIFQNLNQKGIMNNRISGLRTVSYIWEGGI